MKPLASLCLLALAVVCALAYAYEEEDAVTLTIGARDGGIHIGKIDVSLIGSEVEISVGLLNNTNNIKRIGFYANTPFFSAPEIAEDNHEKDFPSLKVGFNGANITVAASTTMGKGRHKGQRFVARSWIQTLRPHAKGVQTISYRALPQFGRDTPTSDRFAQLVAQHCGDVAQVQEILGSLDFVLFDRYQIPVTFMKSHEIRLSVKQPATGAGKRPLVSLACGLPTGAVHGPHFTSNLSNTADTISVLVISAFPGSIVSNP